MLKRALLVLVLLIPTQFLAVPALADPIDCPPPNVWNEATSTCIIVVDDGGGGDGGGGGGGGDDGGGGGGGGDDGGGSGGLRCEAEGRQGFFGGLADPQPEPDHPVWNGHEPGDGAIYVCLIRLAGGGIGGGLSPDFPALYWAADAPGADPPPDPAELAQRAVEQMNLSAITIGIVPEDVPGRVGLVGMPTWMWATNPADNTLGPITEEASAGGFTVTATARVDRIVWNMGDGSSVTCEGAGTPYEDRFGRQPSPDCGHTYTRQGNYDVSATSYWTVQWQGIGETGVINLDLTETTNITVGEAQVISQ